MYELSCCHIFTWDILIVYYFSTIILETRQRILKTISISSGDIFLNLFHGNGGKKVNDLHQ